MTEKPDALQEGLPSVEVLKKLAQHFNERHYKEAISLAKNLTKHFPQHGFGWKVLGATLKKLGQSAVALESLQKAVILLPGDHEVHSNLGAAFRELGQLIEAETCYARALQIKPDYAEAHYNLGNVLRSLGRNDEAEAYYRRALHINPIYAEAHFNMGLLYHEMGRLDEALHSYRQALEIKPKNAKAHFNLGNILRDQDRFSEAEEHFRQASVCKPDSAKILNNLGNLLRDQDRLTDAEVYFRQAIALEPGFAEIHFNLGNALRDLGRLDEAEATYRQVLNIKPNYSEALLCLGHTFLDLDKLREASDAYRCALETDSSSIKALDAAVHLAILYFLNWEFEQCRRLLFLSQPVMVEADKKYRNTRNYWLYLDRLLAYHQRLNNNFHQPSDKSTLYVVGESHALTAHGIQVDYQKEEIRCVAEWIIGCKQWHLGNGKPNKYKHKFEAVLSRLPAESVILLVIGEIDCRHNEGVLKVHKKNPDHALEGIISNTVRGYVDYVVAIAQRYRHKVIVGGVPAPNVPLSLLTEAEVELFIHSIRLFNETLKSVVLSTGMEFLDVYAMTDRGDGIASGKLHMDDYHLLPHTLIEAFNSHLFGSGSG